MWLTRELTGVTVRSNVRSLTLLPLFPGLEQKLIFVVVNEAPLRSKLSLSYSESVRGTMIYRLR